MENINELLQGVISEARAVGVPVSKNIDREVIINKRAKKRFGCCRITKRGRDEYFQIEISEKVAGASEDAIKCTLAHEVIHTCRGCANHGELWSSYAGKMNSAYGYNIKRTDSAENLGLEEDEKKLAENYVLVCEKCGLRIARTRMSKVIKYPQKYRCRCGGRLHRIK